MSLVWMQGYVAAMNGYGLNNNPYHPDDTIEYKAWIAGFKACLLEID
jgi:hypothetical protein